MNPNTPPVLPPTPNIGMADSTPQPQTSGQTPTNMPFSQGGTLPPAPKRKFPIKIILFIVIGLLLVAAVLLFGKSFLKTATKSKVTEITWWSLWEDESVYAPLIAEYEAKNPSVKIKYVKQSQQDYRERLTSSLAKGTGPDIFSFHNSWVPMFAKELDNVPASFMSAADLAQNYYPVVSSDMAYGTGIVGVPLGYDGLALFINDDIFKTAGVEAPTTWDDLRDKSKLLTKTENGVIKQAGVALGRTENIDHWPEILALLMFQNGANPSKPVGKLVEDAILFYSLFSKTDGVWDVTLPTSTEAFAAGKLAMYFGPTWRAFNIKELNPELNFRTVAVPQLAKSDPSDPDVTYATYWAQGVWTKGANKTKAWDFLKHVSSKESLQKVYREAAMSRGFGQIYPRVDMANDLMEHPVLGSVTKLAPEAQSWYLGDRTFDGDTGINTQLKKYFADAINAVNMGESVTDATETLAQGVKQVLTQYGLSK